MVPVLNSGLHKLPSLAVGFSTLSDADQYLSTLSLRYESLSTLLNLTQYISTKY